MILPRPEDALHKAWLVRLLTGLCDDVVVSREILFKGGTCAALLGRLDRFSVDLDFDLTSKKQEKTVRQRLYKIFEKLGLEIKDESQITLQFFLKYPTVSGLRNTIKLEIVDEKIASSRYGFEYFPQIGRYLQAQTKETMFAHKLVAALNRFQKNKTIAGRDIYDIHHFFLQGFYYEKEVIEERTGLQAKDYLVKLIDFVDKKVSQKALDQDLNALLSPEKFQFIRRKLKTETLMFLRDEVGR